jgi:decaprenylphospho-beta-D-ribofuranose 2-oxidase
VQTLTAFHFVLDALPDWQRAFRPHGFLQYQLFVPEEAAAEAFREAIALQERRGAWSHLAVLKRHRAGRFAAPYAPVGYSLALDLANYPHQATSLEGLCRDLEELRHDVGGRLYAAKDAIGVGTLPEVRHHQFSSDLVRRWEAHRGIGA